MMTTLGKGWSAGNGIGAGKQVSGAGHGGYGGGVKGGSAYGSYYSPRSPGSGGGNGGFGGGTILVRSFLFSVL